MNNFRLFPFFILLMLLNINAYAARDVQAELKNIQQQRHMVAKVKQQLATELGQVGKTLQILDINLLSARKAYRNVKTQITAVDKKLAVFKREKKKIRQKMHKLYAQMSKEAAVAYQHTGSRSVWVDVLNGTSMTEIPHRQYLLKQVMLSQEKDRETWRKAMQKLADIERKEQKNKDKLLGLQNERKAAEDVLLAQIKAKREAAKQLQADIQQQQSQEKRLRQQEQALHRLLQGLGESLLESDKKEQLTSIRKRKGKLAWPLKGRVIVGFGKTTAAGTKLAGVHLSPAKRSEEGKLVRAFEQGQVRYADWFGGYGLMMIVDYGHGIMAVYAHNDILHKQLGDWVEQGEILAEAGSTGWIEDVRLYFEIRDKGKPVNPSRWCKK
ncbi:MAG: peptidoglycan DD-metalloendopeptidase family protein [Mariprofundaceae bacterium]|nr:peptidoglycan DD-metalloendopeptidase family protein [Mariprofundaceae bacterium]